MTAEPPAPDIRLLLVDDERSIREPLADYLTSQGFALRAVQHGLLLLCQLHRHLKAPFKSKPPVRGPHGSPLKFCRR